MPSPFPSLGAPSSQRGAASIEFSVVALPLVILGLGAVELANWLYVRQTLSLALLEAARSAATSNARPHAIEAAFERALLPLHAGTSSAQSERRLHQALEERSARLHGPPWQIEIVAPTSASFVDFHQPALSRQFGHATINNSHQAAQHRQHWSQRWPEGVGPASGMTIFDANTLHLRLTYPHEPLLPGVGGLLRMLAGGSTGYRQRAMASGGYLPIRRDVAIVMQSHPVQWPIPAAAKVRGAEAQEAAGGMPAETSGSRCPSWWCPRAQTSPIALPSVPGAATANDAMLRDGIGLPRDDTEMAPPPRPDVAHLAPEPQACGVTVCCVPD